jgi:putative salt-induced outer membrane protein YdiY
MPSSPAGSVRARLLLAACAALAAAAPAQAQVTLKPDGLWRYLYTAGANATAGNSDSTAFNLSGEGVRMTDEDRWTFRGVGAYGKTNGSVTAERYAAGTQYNRNFSTDWFGFGSADALREPPANIDYRWSAASGVGRHLVRTGNNTLDTTVGLGYTQDRYVRETQVLGGLRDDYGRFELVVGEESTHKLSQSTILRQKFTVYPNITDGGNYRAMFDAGLSVAMTPALSLTTGLNYRYNTDPGAGLKRMDASLVTGVSLRFD